MGAFPPRHIPDFEAASSANQCHFTFQPDLATKFLGQDEAALFVGDAMLCSGMQLAQKNAAVPRGNARTLFDRSAHTGELLRGHDEKKLVLGIGQQNKLLGFIAAPA